MEPSSMLKVVLDSSVFTAAILSKNAESAPNKILQKWQQGDFTLVIAPQLQEELVIVLLRKGVRVELVENLVTIIETLAIQIEGVYEATILDNLDILGTVID